MEPVLLSRSEVAKLLNLGLRTVDALVSQGRLRVKKIGRRVLVPRAEVERFARVRQERSRSGT